MMLAREGRENRLGIPYFQSETCQSTSLINRMGGLRRTSSRTSFVFVWAVNVVVGCRLIALGCSARIAIEAREKGSLRLCLSCFCFGGGPSHRETGGKGPRDRASAGLLVAQLKSQ